MIRLNYRKLVLSLVLLLVFIALISWTVQFRFLGIEDFRVLAILIIGTTILMLIGSDSLISKKAITDRLRFNMFFVGLLMSIMLLYDSLTKPGPHLNIEVFFLCFKPMIFVMIIYLPIYNFLSDRNLEVNLGAETDDFTVNLSRREMEVLELIAKGMTNKEISSELFIAENTVKKHVQNILKKTGCTERSSLINKCKTLRLFKENQESVS